MTQQSHEQPLRGSIEETGIVLELSRFWFVVAWWLLMLAHASCGAYLYATYVLYTYLGNIRLIYYNKLLDSALKAQLANLGWLFAVAGSVHALEMLKMVAFSLHARELSLQYQPRKKITPALPPSVVAVRAAAADPTAADGEPSVVGPKAPDSTDVKRSSKLERCLLALIAVGSKLVVTIVPSRVKVALKRLVRALLRLRKALYDRKHGYMSVQSKHFHYHFLIRETIEIASQSYQMYNSSQLLARPWINAFFLALVVTNCWSTPILQHVLAHSTGLERVMCLVLDGLLDAGSAILIPLVVFVPYMRKFDYSALEFPSDLLYDPQWFVNMVRENRMLFAMSWSDLFSKLVPHHSLYSCMKNVKKFIVRRKHREALTVQVAPGIAVAKKPDELESKRVSGSRSRSFLHKSGHVEYPGRGKRLVHVVFTFWGIAVLVIYLHARQVSIRTDVSACKLTLRPWFTTSFACASYNFDCYEQGQVATLMSSDLSILNTASLSALIISNCPAMVMPPELQNFPNLLKFLLYNSSIALWDADASLNAANHTALVSICLVRVNMTDFPLGLQQDLPSALQDVQVSQSNVTALPRTLARKWQPMTLLYFEHCAFADFPLVLLEIRADTLSLAGSNQFTALPANISSVQFSWMSLVLSGNAQLTALPADGMKSGLVTLSLEDTGVREIPSWVYSDMDSMFTSFTIYAYNTPYCASAATAAASSSSGSSSGGGATTGDAGASTRRAVVNCETRDPSGEARYPLALTTSAFQP